MLSLTLVFSFTIIDCRWLLADLEFSVDLILTFGLG
jgi:hypothetical protein